MVKYKDYCKHDKTQTQTAIGEKCVPSFKGVREAGADTDE